VVFVGPLSYCRLWWTLVKGTRDGEPMRNHMDRVTSVDIKSESAFTRLRSRVATASENDTGKGLFVALLLARKIGLPEPNVAFQSNNLDGWLHFPGGVSVRQPELEAVFEATSMARELHSDRQDRHGRFDESAILWNISEPWVSRMAGELGEKVESVEGVEVAPAQPFRVLITHDIDRVTPFEPTSLFKASLGLVGVGKGSWLGLPKAVRSRIFLKNLERMLDLELQFGVCPWFFLLAGRYGLGRFSNRYGIRWNLARETIQLIKEAGGEIGLHGSYHARERNSYREEASLLENVAGQPVIAHRNHYLRFDPRRFWSQLEESGILLDFSLCFSSRMGFRVPVTGPFQPFDWMLQKASMVRAIPTIAMDQVWWPQQEDAVLRELEALLVASKEVGGAVAILIHPEMFSIDPRWYQFYKNLLCLCTSLGARLDSGVNDLIDLSGSALWHK